MTAFKRDLMSWSRDDLLLMALAAYFEGMDLTRQERRVAVMLAESKSAKEICSTIFITENTLKYHVRNINRKLGIRTRRELPGLLAALTSEAERRGWLGRPAKVVSLAEFRARRGLQPAALV